MQYPNQTENLQNVIVYNFPDDMKKKNRGFAFLDYDSHKSASAAKRHITSTHLRVWGAEVYVEWAEPLDEPDDETMSKARPFLLFKTRGAPKLFRIDYGR